MPLNCGFGEDSCESLGLQGDQTSQSWRKSILNIHWKDWCWSWNSNTLVTCSEELTHWKRSRCWERLKAEEKGTTEGEMDGWHHWPDRHEFEQVLGEGEGLGSLMCCSSRGCKEVDMTEWLNNNNDSVGCPLPPPDTKAFLCCLPWDPKGRFKQFLIRERKSYRDKGREVRKQQCSFAGWGLVPPQGLNIAISLSCSADSETPTR